jgi:EAL domain-containing protein (putative c-di-GMP-specific phosphodiesterase class I)
LATAAQTSRAHEAGSAPFGKRPLRTFALVIALPALLLYVSNAALVITGLGGMASEINRVDDARGIASMHAALDSFLNDLSSAVADEGTWDEAFLNVVVNSDPAWMDTTWGATVRLGGSYDSVMVTDQSGAIIFGENNVGPIKGSIITHYPTTRTMLRDLDKGIGATTDATTVRGFATDPDGALGLAAISIHRTTSGQMAVSSRDRRILWIARHITPSVLQDIAVHYQTPIAQFTSTAEPDTSSIELADVDGNTVGRVAWTPERTGDTAFNHAMLTASIVLLCVGALLVVGLGLLRRAMLRRAAKVITVRSTTVDTVDTVPVEQPLLRRASDGLEDELKVSGPLDDINPQNFTIEYQPIFDLRAESLLGVEALLRWTRSDATLVLQEELLPEERAHLFDRIGLIAFRHATGEVAPLLGLALTLAVTPTQLLNRVFAEKVSGTLRATGFPPSRLQLCVDAPLLPDAAQMQDALTNLRQTGVSISLGEFAINSVTADYLDAKLVDRARLSRRLVSGTGVGEAYNAYLGACTDAARIAGLALTAPGLKRREQAARFLRLGCTEFQGALLAQPMPIAALTQLMLAPAKPEPVRKAS